MNSVLTLAMVALGAANAVAQDSGAEMKALAKVESSDGKDLNHKVITKGMHRGTRAGGYYGLMPITVKDLIKASPKLLKKYGYLLSYSNDSITRELNSNRKIDKEIASHFWAKLRQRHTVLESACRWYRGPNSSRCGGDLSNDEYVSKYHTYYSEGTPRKLAVVR